MRREIGKSLMKTTVQKIGQSVVRTATACLLVVAISLLAAQTIGATRAHAGDATPSFDNSGDKIFRSYQEIPPNYLSGDSGDRTLAGYYERRQYPGSPPVVPHPVEVSFSQDRTECLACHAKGGWNAELAASAPLTPHPEQQACRQCHVRINTDKTFVAHDWVSIDPPRLGQAQLPGGPPPIPHDLQMRENCIACHTGPGAVVELRVEHASRGNCRQCHVPLPLTPLVRFEKK